jgi:hypothetical protein
VLSKVANNSPYQIAYYLSNLNEEGVIFSSNFSTGFDSSVALEPSSFFIHQYANLAFTYYLNDDYSLYHSLTKEI